MTYYTFIIYDHNNYCNNYYASDVNSLYTLRLKLLLNSYVHKPVSIFYKFFSNVWVNSVYILYATI